MYYRYFYLEIKSEKNYIKLENRFNYETVFYAEIFKN